MSLSYYQRKKSIFCKAIAISLSILLSFDSIIYAAPSLRPGSEKPVPRAPNLSASHTPRSASLGNLNIPAELARVESFHQGTSGRTVLYIQDAHESLEAQENIAKLIEYGVEHFGVRQVFEEGYEGKVPADEMFGFIADSEKRREFAYFLMDQLRLSGAEYAYINRERADSGQRIAERKDARLDQLGAKRSTLNAANDFELIGADSIPAHLANIRAYESFQRVKKTALEDIDAILKSVKALGDKKFPAPVKKWMKLKERFSSGVLSLPDYLRQSLDISKNPLPLEGLDRLALILTAEASRDPEILKAIRDMSSLKVIEELDVYESRLQSLFLTQPEHVRIYEYYQQMLLVRRLCHFQITSSEYARTESLLRNLKTSEIAEWAARESRRAQVFSNFWENAVQHALEFYHLASERDKAIGKALSDYGPQTIDNRQNEKAKSSAPGQRSMVNSPSSNVSVLVFGGFHSAAIQEILRRRGDSYYVLTPVMSAPSPRHEQYYAKLMSGGVHPYEKIAGLVRFAATAPRAIETMTRAELRALYRQFEAMRSSTPELTARALAALEGRPELRIVGGAEDQAQNDWTLMHSLNHGTVVNWLEPVTQPIWKNFFTGLPKGAKVLDIGSGTDTAIFRMAGYPAHRHSLYAVDIAKPYKTHRSVKYFAIAAGKIGTAEQPSDLPRDFDAVVSQFGIEYAGEGILEKIRSVVTPRAKIRLILHHKNSHIVNEAKIVLEERKVMARHQVRELTDQYFRDPSRANDHLMTEAFRKAMTEVLEVEMFGSGAVTRPLLESAFRNRPGEIGELFRNSARAQLMMAEGKLDEARKTHARSTRFIDLRAKWFEEILIPKTHFGTGEEDALQEFVKSAGFHVTSLRELKSKQNNVVGWLLDLTPAARAELRLSAVWIGALTGVLFGAALYARLYGQSLKETRAVGETRPKHDLKALVQILILGALFGAGAGYFIGKLLPENPPPGSFPGIVVKTEESRSELRAFGSFYDGYDYEKDTFVLDAKSHHPVQMRIRLLKTEEDSEAFQSLFIRGARVGIMVMEQPAFIRRRQEGKISFFVISSGKDIQELKFSNFSTLPENRQEAEGGRRFQYVGYRLMQAAAELSAEFKFTRLAFFLESETANNEANQFYRSLMPFGLQTRDAGEKQIWFLEKKDRNRFIQGVQSYIHNRAVYAEAREARAELRQTEEELPPSDAEIQETLAMLRSQSKSDDFEALLERNIRRSTYGAGRQEVLHVNLGNERYHYEINIKALQRRRVDILRELRHRLQSLTRLATFNRTRGVTVQDFYNLFGMRDADRAKIARWIAAGLALKFWELEVTGDSPSEARLVHWDVLLMDAPPTFARSQSPKSPKSELRTPSNGVFHEILTTAEAGPEIMAMLTALAEQKKDAPEQAAAMGYSEDWNALEKIIQNLGWDKIRAPAYFTSQGGFRVISEYDLIRFIFFHFSKAIDEALKDLDKTGDGLSYMWLLLGNQTRPEPARLIRKTLARPVQLNGRKGIEILYFMHHLDKPVFPLVANGVVTMSRWRWKDRGLDKAEQAVSSEGKGWLEIYTYKGNGRFIPDSPEGYRFQAQHPLQQGALVRVVRFEQAQPEVTSVFLEEAKRFFSIDNRAELRANFWVLLKRFFLYGALLTVLFTVRDSPSRESSLKSSLSFTEKLGAGDNHRQFEKNLNPPVPVQNGDQMQVVFSPAVKKYSTRVILTYAGENTDTRKEEYSRKEGSAPLMRIPLTKNSPLKSIKVILEKPEAPPVGAFVFDAIGEAASAGFFKATDSWVLLKAKDLNVRVTVFQTFNSERPELRNGVPPPSLFTELVREGKMKLAADKIDHNEAARQLRQFISAGEDLAARFDGAPALLMEVREWEQEIARFVREHFLQPTEVNRAIYRSAESKSALPIVANRLEVLRELKDAVLFSRGRVFWDLQEQGLVKHQSPAMRQSFHASAPLLAKRAEAILTGSPAGDTSAPAGFESHELLRQVRRLADDFADSQAVAEGIALYSDFISEQTPALRTALSKPMTSAQQDARVILRLLAELKEAVEFDERGGKRIPSEDEASEKDFMDLLNQMTLKDLENLYEKLEKYRIFDYRRILEDHLYERSVLFGKLEWVSNAEGTLPVFITTRSTYVVGGGAGFSIEKQRALLGFELEKRRGNHLSEVKRSELRQWRDSFDFWTRAIYQPISQEDMKAVLTAYGLNPSLYSLETAGNKSNTAYVLDGQGKRKFVLKRPVFRKGSDALSREDMVLEHLSQDQLSVATMLVSMAGTSSVTQKDQDYVLYDYLDGPILEHPRFLSESDFKKIGRLMARMHESLAEVTVNDWDETENPVPPYVFRAEYLDQDLGRFLDMMKGVSSETTPFAAVFSAHLADIERHAAGIRDTLTPEWIKKLPTQLIHGDFYYNNLIRNAQVSEGLSIFDFEFFHKNARIAEFAENLAGHFDPEDTPLSLERLKWIVQGYETISSAPLSNEELKALPAFFKLRYLHVLLYMAVRLDKAPATTQLAEIAKIERQFENLDQVDKLDWEDFRKEILALRSELRKLSLSEMIQQGKTALKPGREVLNARTELNRLIRRGTDILSQIQVKSAAPDKIEAWRAEVLAYCRDFFEYGADMSALFERVKSLQIEDQFHKDFSQLEDMEETLFSAEVLSFEQLRNKAMLIPESGKNLADIAEKMDELLERARVIMDEGPLVQKNPKAQKWEEDQVEFLADNFVHGDMIGIALLNQAKEAADYVGGPLWIYQMKTFQGFQSFLNLTPMDRLETAEQQKKLSIRESVTVKALSGKFREAEDSAVQVLQKSLDLKAENLDEAHQALKDQVFSLSVLFKNKTDVKKWMNAVYFHFLRDDSSLNPLTELNKKLKMQREVVALLRMLAEFEERAIRSSELKAPGIIQDAPKTAAQLEVEKDYLQLLADWTVGRLVFLSGVKDDQAEVYRAAIEEQLDARSLLIARIPGWVDPSGNRPVMMTLSGTYKIAGLPGLSLAQQKILLSQEIDKRTRDTRAELRTEAVPAQLNQLMIDIETEMMSGLPAGVNMTSHRFADKQALEVTYSKPGMGDFKVLIQFHPAKLAADLTVQSRIKKTPIVMALTAQAQDWALFSKSVKETARSLKTQVFERFTNKEKIKAWLVKSHQLKTFSEAEVIQKLGVPINLEYLSEAEREEDRLVILAGFTLLSLLRPGIFKTVDTAISLGSGDPSKIFPALKRKVPGLGPVLDETVLVSGILLFLFGRAGNPNGVSAFLVIRPDVFDDHAHLIKVLLEQFFGNHHRFPIRPVFEQLKKSGNTFHMGDALSRERAAKLAMELMKEAVASPQLNLKNELPRLYGLIRTFLDYEAPAAAKSASPSASPAKKAEASSSTPVRLNPQTYTGLVLMGIEEVIIEGYPKPIPAGIAGGILAQLLDLQNRFGHVYTVTIEKRGGKEVAVIRKRSELRTAGDAAEDKNREKKTSKTRPKRSDVFTIRDFLFSIFAAFGLVGLLVWGPEYWRKKQREQDRQLMEQAIERNLPDESNWGMPPLPDADNPQTAEITEIPPFDYSALEMMVESTQEDQPEVINRMAARVGAKHVSLTWEGRQAEVFYGAHGHPDSAKGILAIAKTAVTETNKWLLVLEDGSQIVKFGGIAGTGDNQAMLGLHLGFGIPMVDMMEGLAYESPAVIARVAESLKETPKEVKAAFFYKKWLETLSMGQPLGQMLDDLKAEANYNPEEVLTVLREKAGELDTPEKIQAFASLVSNLNKEAAAARTVLGGAQLKEQIKKYPDRKLLVLMGGGYGPMFGQPEIDPTLPDVFKPLHIETGILILRDLKVLDTSQAPSKTGARPELRRNFLSSDTAVRGQEARAELRKNPAEEGMLRNQIVTNKILNDIPHTVRTVNDLIPFLLANHHFNLDERGDIIFQLKDRIGDSLSRQLIPGAARHGEGVTWTLANRIKGGFFSNVYHYTVFAPSGNIEIAVNIPQAFGLKNDMVRADFFNQTFFSENGRTDFHPKPILQGSTHHTALITYDMAAMAGPYQLYVAPQSLPFLQAHFDALKQRGVLSAPHNAALNISAFEWMKDAVEIHFTQAVNGPRPMLWIPRAEGEQNYIPMPDFITVQMLAALTYFYQPEKDGGTTVSNVFPNAGDFVFQGDSKIPFSGKVSMITMRDLKTQVSIPKFIDSLIHLYAADEGVDPLKHNQVAKARLIKSAPLLIANPFLAFQGLELGLKRLHGDAEGRKLTLDWLKQYEGHPLSEPYREFVRKYIEELASGRYFGSDSDFTAWGFPSQRAELRITRSAPAIDKGLIYKPQPFKPRPDQVLLGEHFKTRRELTERVRQLAASKSPEAPMVTFLFQRKMIMGASSIHAEHPQFSDIAATLIGDGLESVQMRNNEKAGSEKSGAINYVLVDLGVSRLNFDEIGNQSSRIFYIVKVDDAPRTELRMTEFESQKQKWERQKDKPVFAWLDDIDGNITSFGDSIVPEDIIDEYVQDLLDGKIRAVVSGRNYLNSAEQRSHGWRDIDEVVSRILEKLKNSEQGRQAVERLIAVSENGGFASWFEWNESAKKFVRYEENLGKKYGILAPNFELSRDLKDELYQTLVKHFSDLGYADAFSAYDQGSFGIVALVSDDGGRLTGEALSRKVSEYAVMAVAFMEQHPVFKNFEPVATKDSLDIEWKGINKILGIRFIQERFNLKEDELATFDDKGGITGNGRRFTQRVHGYSVNEYMPGDPRQVALAVVFGVKGIEARRRASKEIKLLPLPQPRAEKFASKQLTRQRAELRQKRSEPLLKKGEKIKLRREEEARQSLALSVIKEEVRGRILPAVEKNTSRFSGSGEYSESLQDAAQILRAVLNETRVRYAPYHDYFNRLGASLATITDDSVLRGMAAGELFEVMELRVKVTEARTAWLELIQIVEWIRQKEAQIKDIFEAEETPASVRVPRAAKSVKTSQDPLDEIVKMKLKPREAAAIRTRIGELNPEIPFERQLLIMTQRMLEENEAGERPVKADERRPIRELNALLREKVPAYARFDEQWNAKITSRIPAYPAVKHFLKQAGLEKVMSSKMKAIVARPELRRPESLQGITERMPIWDFLTAFGIDPEKSKVESLEGPWGRASIGRYPVLGMDEASFNQAVRENLAQIFITGAIQRNPSFETFVREMQEPAVLEDIYLLTHRSVPVAFVFPNPDPAETMAPLLYFSLMDSYHDGLFAEGFPVENVRTYDSDFEMEMTRFLAKKHRAFFPLVTSPFKATSTGILTHETDVVRVMEDAVVFPGTFRADHDSSASLIISMQAMRRAGLIKDADLESVVEIGAGSGNLTAFIINNLLRNGSELTAYDLTLLKVMNARSNIRRAGLDMHADFKVARTVRGIKPAKLYIWNAPDLMPENEKGPNLDAFLTNDDSRQLNIWISQSSFLDVARDIAEHSPGAKWAVRISPLDRKIAAAMDKLKVLGWHLVDEGNARGRMEHQKYALLQHRPVRSEMPPKSNTSGTAEGSLDARPELRSVPEEWGGEDLEMGERRRREEDYPFNVEDDDSESGNEFPVAGKSEQVSLRALEQGVQKLFHDQMAQQFQKFSLPLETVEVLILKTYAVYQAWHQRTRRPMAEFYTEFNLVLDSIPSSAEPREALNEILDKLTAQLPESLAEFAENYAISKQPLIPSDQVMGELKSLLMSVRANSAFIARSDFDAVRKKARHLKHSLAGVTDEDEVYIFEKVIETIEKALANAKPADQKVRISFVSLLNEIELKTEKCGDLLSKHPVKGLGIAVILQIGNASHAWTLSLSAFSTEDFKESMELFLGKLKAHNLPFIRTLFKKGSVVERIGIAVQQYPVTDGIVQPLQELRTERTIVAPDFNFPKISFVAERFLQTLLKLRSVEVKSVPDHRLTRSMTRPVRFHEIHLIAFPNADLEAMSKIDWDKSADAPRAELRMDKTAFSREVLRWTKQPHQVKAGPRFEGETVIPGKRKAFNSDGKARAFPIPAVNGTDHPIPAVFEFVSDPNHGADFKGPAFVIDMLNEGRRAAFVFPKDSDKPYPLAADLGALDAYKVMRGEGEKLKVIGRTAEAEISLTPGGKGMVTLRELGQKLVMMIPETKMKPGMAGQKLVIRVEEENGKRVVRGYLKSDFEAAKGKLSESMSFPLFNPFDLEISQGVLDRLPNEKIGVRFRLIREERGLSQEEVCDLSGLKIGAYATLENENWLPQAYNIKKYKEVFGLDDAFLLIHGKKLSPESVQEIGFPAVLGKLRERAGWTQDQFAAELKKENHAYFSIRTVEEIRGRIHEWERGIVSVPSDVRSLVAEKLGYPLLFIGIPESRRKADEPETPKFAVKVKQAVKPAVIKPVRAVSPKSSGDKPKPKTEEKKVQPKPVSAPVKPDPAKEPKKTQPKPQPKPKSKPQAVAPIIAEPAVNTAPALPVTPAVEVKSAAADGAASHLLMSAAERQEFVESHVRWAIDRWKEGSVPAELKGRPVKKSWEVMERQLREILRTAAEAEYTNLTRRDLPVTGLKLAMSRFLWDRIDDAYELMIRSELRTAGHTLKVHDIQSQEILMLKAAKTRSDFESLGSAQLKSVIYIDAEALERSELRSSALAVIYETRGWKTLRWVIVNSSGMSLGLREALNSPHVRFAESIGEAQKLFPQSSVYRQVEMVTSVHAARSHSVDAFLLENELDFWAAVYYVHDEWAQAFQKLNGVVRVVGRELYSVLQNLRAQFAVSSAA